MDRRTVLTKTAKGLMEVTGKTSLLPRDQRSVLSHVDGKATVGDLRQKIEKLSEHKLLDVLGRLMRDGFLREFVTAPASVSPPSQVPIVEEGEDLDFTDALQANASRGVTNSAEADAVAREVALARQREAEARAKREEEEKARREAEEKARREAEAKAKREAEERARREADERARREAEARAKREAEEKARREAEEKARREAEAKAKREAEERARREADERARREVEARAKREAEEKARREAEEKAKRDAENKARREAEEKARREAEAKAKHEAEERARREAEEKARREAEEAARREAEAAAKREAEERARREAEAKAIREAEEKARREAEEKARREAEEQAKREAEAKARREAEEADRRDSEARIRRELEDAIRRAEQQSRADAEAATSRREAEAAARRAEEERAQRESDERARRAAEEQARRAAEEQARREAEEQARREAEEQAKRQAEEQARREAEERAQREADARAQREAEERTQREAEERAQREVQYEENDRRSREQEVEEGARRIQAERDQATREAAEREAAARLEADGHREEEERTRKARDEERSRAKAEAEAAARARKEERAREKASQEMRHSQPATPSRAPEAAAAAVAARRKKPANLSRNLGIVAGSVGVLGLAVLQFLPLDTSFYERIASESLAAPVRIQSASFSLLPSPMVKLENVTIGGEQVRIASVRASPELGSMFGDRRAFKSVELTGVSVSPAGLGAVLWQKPKAATLSLGSVVGHDVKLALPGIELPPLQMTMHMAGDGRVERLVLASADRKLNANVFPGPDKATLDLTVATLQVPFGSSLKLADFSARGEAKPGEVLLSEFDAHLWEGMLRGRGTLKYGDGWSFEGDVDLKQAEAAQVVPAVLSSGRLLGRGAFTMRANDPAKLFEVARLEGNFTVQKGQLSQIDLARAMQMGSSASTSTLFNELSGQGAIEPGRLSLRNLKLGAGLLSATGNLEIEGGKQISGKVATEMKTPTGASTRGAFTVSGTLPQVVLKR
jgi:hypothetical protein